MHIQGFRDTLRNESRLPRPDDFRPSTVVFDANAGTLGILNDNDLVEHIVEVYTSVHSVINDAMKYQTVSNDNLDHQGIQLHHFMATNAQLQVMKLHNRLSRGEDSSPHNENETDEETRELVDDWIKSKQDGEEWQEYIIYPPEARSTDPVDNEDEDPN